ncbi:MAG: hypothetical protein V1726_06780 [Methanobacteriota archaeon]
MKKILEDITIIYQDGTTEHYDIIKLSKTGVITGRIINTSTTKENPSGYEIVYYGFIPKHNIKQIKNKAGIEKRESNENHS